MKKKLLSLTVIALFIATLASSFSDANAEANNRGKVNTITPYGGYTPLPSDSKQFLRGIRPSDLPVDSSVTPENDVFIERGRFGFLDESSQDSYSEGGADSAVNAPTPAPKPTINIKVTSGVAGKTAGDNLTLARDSLVAGQYETAVFYYKEALKKEPKNINAIFGLATAYHKSGQEVRAKSLYLQVLRADRQHQGAINNLLSIIAKESPEAALPELERLQKQSPNYAAIPAHIGVIKMKQGDYDSAFKHMQRAATLDPENAVYKYHFAVLLDMMGQAEAAITIYRRVLVDAGRGQALPASPVKISERIEFLMGKVASYKQATLEEEKKKK